MNKINLIFISFLLVATISCKTDKEKSFEVTSNKDKNGLTYETVENDPTGLRLYTLDNGLKVYLSQNSGEPKIQTYIAVRAGSNYDPKESTGLAHYLEHMVFMGSQKYPSENGYEQYANNHGGGCNACTQGEFTVFQFDITAEYYTKALDMFANCFISPLLKMEAADRELKAIESEFAQASVSDDVRFQQIFSHNAADGHVLRKFSWGNMKSLSTVPQAKGVNMESMLRSFHRTHYLPQNMKLVVVAPKSLDAIEKDVKKCFGGWSASATHAQDDAIASLLQEDEKKAAETVKVSALQLLIQSKMKAALTVKMKTKEEYEQELAEEKAKKEREIAEAEAQLKELENMKKKARS